MEFTVNQTPKGKEVRLSGRFTFSDHKSFPPLLEILDGQEIEECIFNFSDVEYMDSVALSLFLLLRHSAEKSGTAMILKGLQDKVRKLFETSKLTHLFIIQP